jgi:hypothetical protein
LRGLIEIINALLCKELNARISSATELKSRLQSLLPQKEQDSSSARAASIRPTQATTQEKRTRRRFWITAMAALVPFSVYLAQIGVVDGIVYLVGLSILSQPTQRRRDKVIYTTIGLGLCIVAVLLVLAKPEWIWSSESILRRFRLLPEDMEEDFAFKFATLLDSLIMVMAAFVFGLLFVGLLRLARDLRRLTTVASRGGKDLTSWLLDQVDSDPGDMALRMELARAFLGEGNPKRAAVQAKLVLDRDPYNYDAVLCLVTALEALGQRAICNQICDRYLAVNPHWFELRNVRARLVIGAIHAV